MNDPITIKTPTYEIIAEVSPNENGYDFAFSVKGTIEGLNNFYSFLQRNPDIQDAHYKVLTYEADQIKNEEEKNDSETWNTNTHNALNG